jgi:hypothetical protein
VERDLAGLPTLGVPPRLLSQAATAEEKVTLAAYQRMLTSMRRDEGEGFIYPLAYDKDGHQLYKLDLLSTGGGRQFDTSGIIARYNQEIAMTALADFILIGHGSQGAGGGKGGTALVENKTNLFGLALSAWLDMIASVFNRYEIPRLFRLNGWPLDKLPELVHGQVEQVDLADLSAYVGNLAAAGMPLFPDDQLENVLRARASLPEKAEVEGAEERDLMPGEVEEYVDEPLPSLPQQPENPMEELGATGLPEPGQPGRGRPARGNGAAGPAMPVVTPPAAGRAR